MQHMWCAPLPRMPGVQTSHNQGLEASAELALTSGMGARAQPASALAVIAAILAVIVIVFADSMRAILWGLGSLVVFCVLMAWGVRRDKRKASRRRGRRRRAWGASSGGSSFDGGSDTSDGGSGCGGGGSGCGGGGCGGGGSS